MDIARSSIARLRRAVQDREWSVERIADSFLKRIDRYDGILRCYLTVDADEVREEARRQDQAIRQGGPIRPLAGVPIAVKDNILTQGLRTTCGSRMLADFVPPYDAAVVERLRKAGAIVLGKTNCDEFSMGSSGENSAFFATRNPWALDRTPGGSSSGSAAATASFLAAAALGSDTGGSIRQPAAFCGVVGLKPTYGRVSRFGLTAFASSLDQIGPLARSVRDLSIVLQAIAGRDERDATSSLRPPDDFEGRLEGDVQGMRIGVLEDCDKPTLNRDVHSAIDRARSALEDLGCRLEPAQLPNSRYAMAIYQIVAAAEASSNLARFDGVRYGFRVSGEHPLSEMYALSRSLGLGTEVKRRIMLGTFALSAESAEAYYLRASRARRLVLEDYLKAFERFDALLGPVTPTPPFMLGEKTHRPVSMYLSDLYTVTANLAGVPALSLPIEFNRDSLPLAVQLQTPHFQESDLLRLAYSLERRLDLEPPKPAFESMDAMPQSPE